MQFPAAAIGPFTTVHVPQGSPGTKRLQFAQFFLGSELLSSYLRLFRVAFSASVSAETSVHPFAAVGFPLSPPADSLGWHAKTRLAPADRAPSAAARSKNARRVSSFDFIPAPFVAKAGFLAAFNSG